MTLLSSVLVLFVHAGSLHGYSIATKYLVEANICTSDKIKGYKDHKSSWD